MDPRLRQRLEALNRGPLTAPPRRTRAAARDSRASRSPLPPLSSSSIAGPPRPVPPLPGVLRRGQVVNSARGEHLRVELPIEILWSQGPTLLAQRHQFVAGGLTRNAQSADTDQSRPAEWIAWIRSFPDGVLLMDLETCGLAGSVVFLIGLLRWIEGRPCVELLLARDYAEEAAVLATFWKIAARHPVLVTFNGKSFDWPMLIDRTTRHRFAAEEKRVPECHFDTLHHARRRWNKQLSDCRLQTIERHICLRTRVGDIASSAVPAAYQQFVTTGSPRDVEEILYHNAVDLITLLDITMRLVE